MSDRIIAGGGSPTKVRKGFVVAGFTLALLMVPVAFVEDETAALSLLMMASLLFGLYSSNLWAITQTIAGPAASGKWTGMQNGFGNLAGVVAPALTGWVVEETGSFKIAFMVVAVMLVVGACAFQFIVSPGKPVTWSNAAPRGRPP